MIGIVGLKVSLAAIFRPGTVSETLVELHSSRYLFTCGISDNSELQAGSPSAGAAEGAAAGALIAADAAVTAAAAPGTQP